MFNTTITNRSVIPGAPVDINLSFSAQSTSDFAAVLITPDPVVHLRYVHEDEFDLWCRENHWEILRQHPSVKEHGLWIIQDTWSTSSCTIKAWREKTGSFHASLSGDVAKVGNLGVTADKSVTQDDGNWSEYPAEEVRFNLEKILTLFRGEIMSYLSMV